MTRGPQPKQRAQFFRELAQLTGAGISVTQAAKVLGQEWREDSVKRAIASMEQGLAEGRTIADALSASLTPMEHSIIGAAERGGKLADGFRHLEEYYALLAATGARARTALLYPLAMLHAAVLLPALVGAVVTGGSAGDVVKAVTARTSCVATSSSSSPSPSSSSSFSSESFSLSEVSIKTTAAAAAAAAGADTGTLPGIIVSPVKARISSFIGLFGNFCKNRFRGDVSS
jgi:hypothetical protein